MQLKTYFSATPDHRQAPGRRYNIGHLPLFSVLAVVLGSISYRASKYPFHKVSTRSKALVWTGFFMSTVFCTVAYRLTKYRHF